MKSSEKNQGDRKKDHIDLATQSQVSKWRNDKRFYYEPLHGVHSGEIKREISFFNQKLQFPLWVSSMTGGTPEAEKINQNLAKACQEFGLGMGLGSCRALLDSPERLPEFNLREYIGDQPLYANLGIAQLEKSLAAGEVGKIEDLIGNLKADGLIIHVNPLQEFIQPEGDQIAARPIETIENFLSNCTTNVIVKEVGQGMGPESLKSLMKLPVMIEFAAFGGTNFSQVELSRNENHEDEPYDELVNIGHNMDEMIGYANEILASEKDLKFMGFIASGGIGSYLDGYYAVKSLNAPSIYGQASALLKKARISYEALQNYVKEQIRGYQLAEQYLTIRKA